MPVLDGGRMAGIVASRDIALVPVYMWKDTLAGNIMKTELILGYESESLRVALDKMTKNNISHLPIVNQQHPNILVGIITTRDIALSYDRYKEDLEEGEIS